MMVRGLKILLLLVALLFPIVAAAQDQIKWSAKFDGSPKPGETATILLEAKIEKDWHLYALPPTTAGNIPTTIEVAEPMKLAGKIQQPKPIHERDPNFEAEVDYFENSVVFRVPVKLGPSVDNQKLSVQFQACNATTCIPPTTVEVVVGATAPPPTEVAGTTGEAMQSEADRLAAAKAQGLLPFMLFAFGAGLLALLTPCVFPMVPITVSFFAKRRETVGSGSGIVQALAFCLGIIGAFAGFGLVVTLIFGASSIQLFATNPWVNIAIGILFVVLAFNLFGFYQINVPSGIANKFNPHGKAGLLAPILMGLTFTITSFTCTVPFVGTILVSASQGEWVYPLFGMLAFGTAFALPFFFLALFPQFLAGLPKSGAWLDAVKGYMGFLELAAAVKFFSNADLVWNTGILPRDRFLYVWIALGVATLAFLVGFIKLPHVDMPKKFGRGRIVVTALTAVAVLMLILGVGPKGRSLGELEAFLPPSHSGWIEDYKKAQQLARTTGKPMFINFTGVTCTNCRWMEKNMFPREDVSGQLGNFVPVELFTDRQTPGDRANQALQKQLTGTVTLPVYVIVTPDGQVIRKFESSTRDSEEFVAFLKGNGNEKVASK
jgi:thiol:disulfide interchange protein DsbD